MTTRATITASELQTIDAKIGVTLNYTFDDKQGQELGVTVSGTLPGESQPRTITGRVKDLFK
mgnify:CR=1 FL=1